MAMRCTCNFLAFSFTETNIQSYCTKKTLLGCTLGRKYHRCYTRSKLSFHRNFPHCGVGLSEDVVESNLHIKVLTVEMKHIQTSVLGWIVLLIKLKSNYKRIA